MKRKALPICVYRRTSFNEKKGTSCLSDRYDTLLLLCDDGFIDVDMNNPLENLVIIDTNKIGHKVHSFIRPYAEPKAAGWMAGANIGYTCDSRFGYDYPLQIYDLNEDWDTYYAISNS